MDQAGAVEDQAEVEVDASGDLASGSVRVYENRHCHIDRLDDGRFLIYNDTVGVVMDVLPANRLDLAHAVANRTAGPPRKPKAPR